MDIRQLQIGDNVENYFKLVRIQEKETSSGNRYFKLRLENVSGRIEAIYWNEWKDYKTKVNIGGVVFLKGKVQQWNGQKQIKISKIRVANDDEVLINKVEKNIEKFIKLSNRKSASIVLSHESNHWDKIMLLVEEVGAKWIDIATYNFNFEDRSNLSLYHWLCEQLNNDVYVRLLYNIDTNSGEKINTATLLMPFSTRLELIHLRDNHVKMFLSDKIGYIGSANFSVSSHNNYECGILFSDPKLINEVRENMFEVLVSRGDKQIKPWF